MTNSVNTEASGANANILDLLHQWADAGWLRRLDSAMASFMQELDPSATAALVVSTAMLAQMEGRGHTCLPLRLLVTQPEDVLTWPPAAQEELIALWQTLPTTVEEWLRDLKASHLVRIIGSDEGEGEDNDHGQPLVLSGTPEEPLLYLRRYWLHEHQVAQQIKSRTAASQNVDEALAHEWLARLFTDSAVTEKAGQMDWQKMACAVALRSGLTVITGGPGTGKTYTAARLLALLFAMHAEPQRLRVGLAAPTGKAAARLRQSIDFSLQDLNKRLGDELDLEAFTKRIGAAKTLHSLLGARPDTRHFIFNANHQLDVDILIVDEASMIHLEMMSALLQALPTGAKLILLGDKDQLASVEAGAVLGDLCRDAFHGCYDPETVRYARDVTGLSVPAKFMARTAAATALAQQTVMLRESHRFGGLIGQLALAVNASNTELVQSLIENDTTDVLHASCSTTNAAVMTLAVHGRDGASACYGDYLRLMNARPPEAKTHVDAHAIWAKSVLIAFERFRILCVVHEGDWGTRELNRGVQQALSDANLLNPKGEWFAGRAIMVTRNDSQLGVSNGDVGVALPTPDSSATLRVYFLVGDKLRSVGVSRLTHVDTAFAMTVHKCQGSEFLHTALVLPQGGAKVMTRELVYTGITRASTNFTLIEAQAGLLRAAITQRSPRASGLGLQLSSP